MSLAMIRGLSLDVWAILLHFLEDEQVLLFPSLARCFYEDSSFSVLLVDREGFSLQFVSLKQRTKAFSSLAITNCSGCIHCALRLWKSIPGSPPDEDLTLLMASLWPSLIPTILPETWRSRENVLSILRLSVQHSSVAGCNPLDYFLEWQKDRELILEAVALDGRFLRSASLELQKDRDVALKAIASRMGWLAINAVNPALYREEGFLREVVVILGENMYMLAAYIGEHQLDLAIRAVEQSPLWALRDLCRGLRCDPRVWKRAIEGDALAAQFVPSRLLTLPDAMAAVRRTPKVFCVLGHWLMHKDLALLALSLDGALLGNPRVRARWNDDRDVVLSAVRQNGLALENASENLREDDSVLREALQQNGLSLAFASRRVRESGKYVKIAIKQNSQALSFSYGCQYVFARLSPENWPAPVLPRAPPCLPIHAWQFLE